MLKFLHYKPDEASTSSVHRPPNKCAQKSETKKYRYNAMPCKFAVNVDGGRGTCLLRIPPQLQPPLSWSSPTPHDLSEPTSQDPLHVPLESTRTHATAATTTSTC